MISLIAIFVPLAVGMVLVIYGSLAENKWGINFRSVSCPRCEAPLAPVRLPRSLRQALWGGHSCPICGAQVDKWGRELRVGGAEVEHGG